MESLIARVYCFGGTVRADKNKTAKRRPRTPPCAVFKRLVACHSLRTWFPEVTDFAARGLRHPVDLTVSRPWWQGFVSVVSFLLPEGDRGRAEFGSGTARSADSSARTVEYPMRSSFLGGIAGRLLRNTLSACHPSSRM